MKTNFKSRGRFRRGLTLIELTVVILVLLALITVLFIGGRAWKKGADRSGCIINIRNVQQAIRSHQNLTLMNDGAPIDILADLVGPGNYVESTPACPGGGTYAYVSNIPSLGTLAMTCSLQTSEQHVPATITGW